MATQELPPFHPIANHWPLLADDELQRLADDIKANGLHNPIWLHRDGRIIDGRNRWLACQRAGVECRTQVYPGEDGAALVAFVLSQNEMRRHLPIDQRAAIAAELAKVSHGGDRSKSSGEDLTQGQAAEVMGVSKQSVERAARLKREAPDLHEEVKAGKMKAGKARKTADARKGVEISHRLSDEEQTWRKPAPKEDKAKPAPEEGKLAKSKKLSPGRERAARWAAACAACREAMAELEGHVADGMLKLEDAISNIQDIQAEYAEALENMGNLASSAAGARLEEVAEFDTEGAPPAIANAIEEAKEKLEEGLEALSEVASIVEMGWEANNAIDEMESLDA